jgi:hypothetical protein
MTRQAPHRDIRRHGRYPAVRHQKVDLLRVQFADQRVPFAQFDQDLDLRKAPRKFHQQIGQQHDGRVGTESDAHLAEFVGLE